MQLSRTDIPPLADSIGGIESTELLNVIDIYRAELCKSMLVRDLKRMVAASSVLVALMRQQVNAQNPSEDTREMANVD